MAREMKHPVFGILVLRPDEWRWAGMLDHGGVKVPLSLNTYRPDQVPGLHITEIVDTYCDGLQMILPQIAAYLRQVAVWICSDLHQWFEERPALDVDTVLHRLKLSSVDLKPDGSVSLWIDEPHLEDSGHIIKALIGTDGKIKRLDLAG